MNENFAELFEQSQIVHKMRLGTIVNATVIDISNDNVWVSAGLKSESVIPISQFLDQRGEIEVAIGDEVEVSLDAVEDGFGETRLSREKAKHLIAWSNLEKAHESDEIVTGTILERIKGGFTVDVNGVKAFLPRSLADVYPVKDIVALIGRPLEFKIVKIDHYKNNIVVSRRAVLSSNYASVDSAELMGALKEGAVIEGIVKNTTDYGAFIDLGGFDGLLHITDMAWKRVKSTDEIVSVGDKIKVKVLKYDRERNRVSLGLKQMADDPWDNLLDRYSKGAILLGKVTNLTDYGCFVELEEGIEGLVHVSEMDWTKKNIHPPKLVQVGEEVNVIILDIDHEKRRISLSIKRCKPNPWEEFSAIHKKGDRVVGIVKSITDFGIFVGLEGNIDGLVHISDITWTGTGEESIRQYNKGDEVTAIVLAVEAQKCRVCLGIKQINKDPFAVYIDDNPKGAIVKAVVKEIDAKKGLVMSLAEDVLAYMRPLELPSDKADNIRNTIKENDEMEVKITAIDRKKRSINVSVKAKEADDEISAQQEYKHAGTDDEARSTLGDILKKHLDK